MIQKILVANRGEIAVRVMRTCKEMGIQTVAVYSEVDRTSRHVTYADEAVKIGLASASDSYLNVDKIIDAAKTFKVDAIHPGYGFLSENATFARRCKEEGIIFIGPSAESIEAMGDKISARKKMIEAKVPVVPGTSEDLKPKDLFKVCRKIGLPVIIKATAGGGGKGMRLVYEEKHLQEAYDAAKSEAMASFGNDSVYIEKYIESPHHVEIQFLGDTHGNVVHLFDRECSVQRRHQKIIEESPSPFIDNKTRLAMGAIAVKAAKSINYVGAGTIEFLVDNDMNFYFLEMNTRLQVEHPITEEVLGVDIVKEQINIANGRKLSFRQSQLHQRGHAIECRIYAEDTENNFAPAPGVIHSIQTPKGLGVRIDTHIYTGYEISIYYDSMISKLIVWATNRDVALERMRRVLYEYKITGVKTNIDYLRRIMDNREFVQGNYTTHFIDDNANKLQKGNELEDEIEDIAIIAAYIDYVVNSNDSQSTIADNQPINRWRAFGKQKGVLRI
ncbi:MAG: acetyl-CoA carboxylase biotin carboxylase subunit [Fermentimonas sp.]|jgi:acetyl-CoA carboxylase biotin carboxylase subunit|nr:acetyl-CoA carboxylase biotin carboxylase subunit [Fermentimonas sp.]NLC86619.1 acetyl-CoA carboxylase biotin carboxylase subunit [Bacteroidales bacterium]HBT84466.1 acetyl-CoA carboxylase biotin carboxylase subunit [Porphyromonadaceae bacterium]MDD2930329.1 acetyl-CoA carboxylase biotin carboxylase subunit [Fermentimonas sp.]MDD3188005.1 acetyl-CoA carboxylase biotin carboxylase subunit [Fermentimonas sp.]